MTQFDLLADVDGRAVHLQRTLDRLDRPLDAGAVAPVRSDDHALHHCGEGNQSAPDPASPRWDDVSAGPC